MLEDAKLASKTFVHAISKKPPLPADDINDLAKCTLETCVKPISLFRRNRLYFNAETADKIDTLLYDFQSPAGKHDIHTRLPEEPGDRESIIQAWDKKAPDIEKLMSGLEGEFREILGSSEENKLEKNTKTKSV